MSDMDLMDKLIKDLHILKWDHSIERVKTTHFIFPSNVEQIELLELSEPHVSFLKEFVHMGIVNKNTAVEPLKKNQVLLTVGPSFVAPAAYEDRSRTYLGGTKKVRTIIFNVSQKVFNNIQSGVSTSHKLIAAAAMSTQVDDWKFFEAKVMSSLFHLVSDSSYEVSADILNKIWKEFPTSSLESVWRQMLFLCCGPFDVSFHVKQLLKRNSARIAKLLRNEENKLSMEGQTISEYKILYLLSEWCRFSFDVEPMLSTLKEINATKPLLVPAVIFRKISEHFANEVTAAKKHRCSQCRFQTNRNDHMEDHLRIHTGEKPFACAVCGMKFSQLGGRTQHMAVHRVIKAFSCNLCGRSFTRRPRLLYHLATHQKKGTLNYVCYACKKTFENEDSLKDHMSSHSNDLKFGCKQCPKKFLSRQDLQNHNSLHVSSKPFECTKCDKSFLYENNLKQHMVKHNPDKCFSCDYCGMSFKVNSTRLTHQFWKHEKSNMFNEREDLQRAAKQKKTDDPPNNQAIKVEME